MEKHYDFKTLNFEEMRQYIEENAPEDKAWFKSVAIDKNDKYQHIIAKRAFCKRYMPEIIPVAKPKKPKKTDVLKDW